MQDIEATPTIEDSLREIVQREEATASLVDRSTDSLWDHLCRTAKIAEHIGRAEGIDPTTCRLAALFHDAGKFHNGQLHGDSQAEEVHSVEVFRRLADQNGISKDHVDEISEAILQLYRDDPDPTPLARVLFDADNLDKLGHLGVANFFVKRGLRGGGISPDFLVQFTVELTYARHAEACMQTEAGRIWARRRAPQARGFYFSLLDQLREDGLFNMAIKEVEYDGLLIDAVTPEVCNCGRAMAPEIRQEEGI
ncbi:MAG: HD domain-containing protein, partial [bacterium]|nr:HD domain-containing protein [bacterium]